jgi:hypothetical protein
MIHNLDVGDLRIEADESTPGSVHLRWLGSSNARDPGTVLQAYFNVVLAEATSRKLQVVLQFEQLAYFNSSTVGFLLRLVAQAASLSLPLELRYDASLRWQAHNFQGIEAIARAAPQVKVVAIRTTPA